MQSGARPTVHTRTSAAALTRAWLEALGLPRATLADLRALPVDRLVEAGARAAAAVAKVAPRSTGFMLPSWYWQPLAGVPGLPDQPFDRAASAVSTYMPAIGGERCSTRSFGAQSSPLNTPTWPVSIR